MSNNTDYVTSEMAAGKAGKESLGYVKKSLWGEVSAVSGLVLLLIVAVVVGSVAAFIYMNRIPPKSVFIKDDASIFSQEQMSTLSSLAEILKDENDINVVIATTRNNPYGTSDDDCKEYAAAIYKEDCIATSMQDNSGICIYIDLTIDKPGSRFFWLYTYGTAYYSVDDEECTALFRGQKSILADGNYADAIANIMRRLDSYDFHSTGLVLTYALSIGVPLILALIVTALCTMKGKLDPVPASAQYKEKAKCKILVNGDDFLRKTTRVYHHESSSGGGGGGHGGGGGGGHSGGGGGRF